MSYVASSLNADESILKRARLHPVVFVPALIPLLLGIALLPATLTESSGMTKSLAFIAAAVGIVAFVRILIEYLTTEYAVTSQRVISKSGWIARRTTETLLGRVEGVHLRQSVIGRVLNYGTVLVSGTGDQKNVIASVFGPVAFMRVVQDEAERSGRG